MTVVVDNRHPVRDALLRNGVTCISNREACRQDIRPLRIGILNLMPKAETYEFNLLLPLGRSILQIVPVWMRLESHAHGSSNKRHLDRYYVTYDRALADGGLDGLIVTGAPVEELPFEDVRYWPEFCEVLQRARRDVCSTLGICWGGLALARFVGIQKVNLAQKLFGLFETRNLKPRHPITGGLDDWFWCPQSRHAGIPDAVLEAAAKRRQVRLLAHSGDAGYTIFETPDHRFVMHLGHHEYNSRRLVTEAVRDRRKGRTDVGPPRNFDLGNPVNRWRANRNEFYSAWIRHLYLEGAGRYVAHKGSAPRAR